MVKYKHLILIAITAVLIIACGAGTQHIESPSSIGKSKNGDLTASKVLEGLPLGLGDLLTRHFEFFVKDSLLIIEELRSEYFLKLIDIKNRELLGQTAKLGRGPQELLSVGSLDYFSDKDVIWIFDVVASRIYNVKFTDVPPYFDLAKNYIQLEDSVKITNHFIYMSDTSFLALDEFNGTHRMYMINNKGEIIKGLGSYPENKDNLPNQVLARAYLGLMKPNPDRSKVAIISIFSDRLDIFDLENNGMITAYGPEKFPPIFEVREVEGLGPMFASTPETRKGFSHLSTTSKYIYVLYSGKVVGDYDENPSQVSMGNQVFVYDWEGDNVAILELDRELESIFVDGNDTELFGLESKMNIDIVKYDLSEILN